MRPLLVLGIDKKILLFNDLFNKMKQKINVLMYNEIDFSDRPKTPLVP